MIATLLALACASPLVSATYSRDLQVFPPVLALSPSGQVELSDSFVSSSVTTTDKTTCEELLTSYTFGNSYGVPFVGEYKPPSCSFNRVTWNMTVSVAGVQYDRLGVIFLGDIEVWRPTTAEPTEQGIFYTYLKDMTPYLSLLKSDQTLTFELDNIVNDEYTGSYVVTLTSQFFTTDVVPNTPADEILGMSDTTSTGGPTTFSVPSSNATAALTLPQNVKRAVFALSATGQSDEEFWWSNVPTSRETTFGAAGTLFGYSPFREVQLFIDGTLAGVAWPYPVIFTGGVVPGLWRPIVGIDALDLKDEQVDITPFLPLLCDGKSHTFTIRVAGLNDNGKGGATIVEEVGSYWLVTGKIFLWLDTEGHVTTGIGPTKLTPAPILSVTSQTTTNANKTANETLTYAVSARRQLSYSSVLNLAAGETVATWIQNLEYSATGDLTNEGDNEINTQTTSGTDLSSSGYARSFSYPFYALSTFVETDTEEIIYANINRGKIEKVIGPTVLPSGLESFVAAGVVSKSNAGSSLVTYQNATGYYIANDTAAISYGTTEQEETFSSLNAGPVTSGTTTFPAVTAGDELFKRYVVGVNGTITEDQDTILGTEMAVPHVYEETSLVGLLLSGIPGRGGKWAGKPTNPDDPSDL